MKQLWLFLLLPAPLMVMAQVTPDATIKTNTNIQVRSITAASGITKGNVANLFDALTNSKLSRIEANSTSGTNTYTVSIAWVTAYTFGTIIPIQFVNGNTGASTLNINSLGAISIKKLSSSALVSGDIVAGQAFTLFYDGTNFQLIGGGVSQATSSVAGITKLYTTTGVNTDGTMDQNSITAAIAGAGPILRNTFPSTPTTIDALSTVGVLNSFDGDDGTAILTLTDGATVTWDWKSKPRQEVKWAIGSGVTARTLTITNMIFAGVGRLKIQKQGSTDIALTFSHSGGNPGNFFTADDFTDYGFGPGNITVNGITLSGPANAYFDIVFSYDKGFNGMFVDWIRKGDITSSTTGVSITGGSSAVIGPGTTINIAFAGGSTTGLLTSSNWNTFNNKLDDFGSQAANKFLASPNGSSGSMSPRLIVSADIPTLNQNTTGTASNLSGTPALPNGTIATTQSASDNSTKLATTAYVDGAIGGFVSTPFADNIDLFKNNSDATKKLRFALSSITTGTTRTATWPDANITVARNDAAQTFTGVQTFSSLPVFSVPLTTLGTIGTGVWQGTKITEAYGGTNQSSYAAGDILRATGSTTLSKLAIGTSLQILRTNSGATDIEYSTPSYSQITSQGDIEIGDGSGNPSRLAIGANHTFPRSNGTTISYNAVDLTSADVTGALGAANGGSGIANNAASTWTISGNFGTTITVSGTTTITLPTSGTMATLAGTETFTNKRINPRVVTATDATSITPTGDASDVTKQLNTQSTGTLTINAPTGTPVDGQKWSLLVKSTNIQTFSWNAIFAGCTTTALPTASTGSSKFDLFDFIYNSTMVKWTIKNAEFGY